MVLANLIYVMSKLPRVPFGFLSELATIHNFCRSFLPSRPYQAQEGHHCYLLCETVSNATLVMPTLLRGLQMMSVPSQRTS